MALRIRAGELDRSIIIRRAITVDDGLAARSQISTTTASEPGDLARRAKKTDVSDNERILAAQNGIALTCRFLVRYENAIIRLTTDDVIICADVVYEVVGAKEVRGRRAAIEITAVARPYPPDQL